MAFDRKRHLTTTKKFKMLIIYRERKKSKSTSVI